MICPNISKSHIQISSSAFPHSQQQHFDEHFFPFWKHSQYFFKHPLFLQLQLTSVEAKLSLFMFDTLTLRFLQPIQEQLSPQAAFNLKH